MEQNLQISGEATDTIPSFAEDNNDTAKECLSTTLTTAEEPFVTVKYNHNLKNYSLKEAADIIQKSMHYDSSIKKLQFLASSKGQKLPELVNEIFETAEQKEIARLQEEFAEDENGFTEALQLRKEKFERAFIDMLKAEDEKPNLNQRLADEYFELLEYFPEVDSIDEIPDEVLTQCAKTEKSLVLCYAINKAKEQAKLLKDAEKKEKNNLSSAPPLSSNSVAGEDPTIVAMLNGLRK